ncbi:hypothetical protein BN2537_14919 [Streptomyces venezuelae]|nr:hypothetical protein BN2537_14919 [Streptomyces venezuelae]
MHRRLQQLPLPREVVRDESARRTGTLRDVAERGRLVAVRRYQVHGGLQNPLT